MPASMSMPAVSVSLVFTVTPGLDMPEHANIFSPTFQTSCPMPQGSETSAPGSGAQTDSIRFLNLDELVAMRSP